MYDKDKETIINRYNERLNRHGDAIETLAVGNEMRQLVRFEVLCGIGDLRGKSILDVGSGFGDFFGFLKSKEISSDYMGYDMNPKLVDVARERYPEAKFQVLDFLTDDSDEKFDYVISSTSFNNKFTEVDNYEMVEKVIARSFDMCRKGVAINFMTDYVDYKTDYAFYYSPERIFKFCKSICNRVAMRHDYCLYEFTIFMYKEDCEWKKTEKRLA
jgi:2-polyprenyl-3-methyl-5-hydroxy-6-metoxy-1,4-benzoquinol methylase